MKQIQEAYQEIQGKEEDEEDLVEIEKEVADDEESKEERKVDPVVREHHRKEVLKKSKTKLEKLLAQSDIFDCLRRLSNGEIKSLDELDNIQADLVMAAQ